MFQLGWLWPCPQIIRPDWKGFPSSLLGLIISDQGDQIGQNFAIWAIFYGNGQNFSHEKNRPKLTLIRLKFCSKNIQKFYLLFYVKKTIRECPVPLDISIKSNRKHHKIVLYSKSNKNMVGQLYGQFFIVFGDFFTKTSGHPVSDEGKKVDYIETR